MWQYHKQVTKSAVLCIFIFWMLTACQNVKPEPQVTNTVTPIATAVSAVPSKITSPSPPPPTPTLTALPTLTPTLTNTPVAPFPNQTWTIEPQQFQTAEHDLLHNVVLFTSPQENPFNSSSGFIISQSGYPTYDTMKLFALSPDGQRVGRVSPDDRPSAIFLPTNDEETIAIVAYDFYINHPDVETIVLPSECYDEDKIANRESNDGMFPCRQFMFFLNRRYFAYTIGAISWQTVIDRQTDTLIKRGNEAIGNEFPTGKALFFALGSDGGDIGVIDLHTLSPIRDNWNVEWLGYAGNLTWNAQRTAFVISASTLEKANRWVWGYNAELDFVFLPQSDGDKQFDSTPIWTPDGTHVLFRHRAFEFERIDGVLQYTFDQSSEIIKVNSETGEKSVLVSDPAFDHRICNATRNCATNWHDDWLPIFRMDFEIITETVKYEGDHPFAAGCLLDDYCEDQAQTLALNWRTGEITTLEDAGIDVAAITAEPNPTPTLTPQPIFLRPALYTHPDGEYELYVGQDEHTLWYMASGEEPVLWVQDGENFAYLP